MQKLDNDLIRLNDILRMITDIERITTRSRKNKTTLFAVAYGIAVIGEAAGKLSGTLKRKHKHIPWTKITGTRHKIIHDYGKLDEQILWNVVKYELPSLKKEIKAIISTLE